MQVESEELLPPKVLNPLLLCHIMDNYLSEVPQIVTDSMCKGFALQQFITDIFFKYK